MITPGALFKGGRKRKNIVNTTGWISFDIDQKDNPQIKDWELAKKKIGNVMYVAYCALSASGQGC